MPSRPKSACSCRGCDSCQGRCPELTAGGKCDGCAKDYAKVIHSPERAKVYASKRWKALRRQVLREQPWCDTPGCHALSRDVDHIQDMADGGAPYDRHNLHGLCKPCHSAKTMTGIRNR